MPNLPPLVLLAGSTALELGPRLEASGYNTGPLIHREMEGTASLPPSAVILSPFMESLIPDLRQRWGALPILLGCEQDNLQGRFLALGCGADDLWLTSAGPSDLLTRLRLHLKLRQTTNQPISPAISIGAEPIIVGNLLVDPQGQIVQRNSQTVPLTTREFQLLLLLIRHSPNVVSRSNILKDIWPEERGAASNVIEVYIRYLRRKLEAGNQSRLIHTVRGIGYCLKE